MSNIPKAQADYIFVEKVDYNEEQTTDAGIIIKRNQMLDSSFVETKILSMGSGLPLPNGEIPPVDYKVGSTIVYDARNRIGISKEYDVIRREAIIAVVED